MNRPSFMRLATLCLLCSVAVPAFAQEEADPSGTYVGGAVGWLRAGELSRGAVN